jgi:hypothetical protein
MFLNWLKLAIFLKSSGRSFHKTAAVYLLSDCRTIGPSDYRTVGLSDCRTIGLSDYRSDPEDYNNTYEELLHIAKVPSLQIRRMRTMALECFKILYKLSPPCLNDLVVLKNSNLFYIVLDILIL